MRRCGSRPVAETLPAADPFIVTLALDDASQEMFDRLRRQHFPATRNLIPAHLTLFHHLPGGEQDAVQHSLRLAAAAQPGFPVLATGLRSLGRGVAFAMQSDRLLALRAGLARHWHGSLTAQDRQGWRPHVTIQNKAAPNEAAALLAAMQAAFVPFAVQAEGLLLWRYRGGPWQQAARFPFGPGADPLLPSPA